MDSETLVGIKLLWAAAACAAFLKSWLPSWFGPETTAWDVPPDTDLWEVFLPRGIDPSFHITDCGDPYPADMVPTLPVRLKTERLHIDIFHPIDGTYEFAWGGIIRFSGDPGLLLHWKRKYPKQWSYRLPSKGFLVIDTRNGAWEVIDADQWLDVGSKIVFFREGRAVVRQYKFPVRAFPVGSVRFLSALSALERGWNGQGAIPRGSLPLYSGWTG